MVHFSLNIKACCIYVIWEKQDKIWAKMFCILKNMHSRTPMVLREHFLCSYTNYGFAWTFFMFLHNLWFCVNIFYVLTQPNCEHKITDNVTTEHMNCPSSAIVDRPSRDLFKVLKRPSVSRPHALDLRRSCSDGKQLPLPSHRKGWLRACI